MAKDFDSMEDSNRSANPSIHDVSEPSRRMVLRGTLGVAVSALYAPLVAGCAASGRPRDPTPALAPSIGFKGIAVDASDKLLVPEGYIASVIAAWGEPVGVPGNMPAWKGDGSHSAAEQAVQMGMHHDGIHFYPLEGNSSTRGLLAMNHEYTDDGLLHSGGLADWSAEKVKKSQAAHGLSVIEVAAEGRPMDMVRPSRYARRFTAEHAVCDRRALRRPSDDEDRGRCRRQAGAGHVQQLRQQQDTLGHLPLRRRKLHGLFQRRRQPVGARTALGHEKGRLGLQLARPRRALRRGEKSERAEPPRLGGRGRSVRPDEHAGQAHRARPRRARRGVGGGDEGRPRGGVLGRGRALRVHLQVRLARQDQTRRRQDRMRRCSTTARCTWRASTPTAAGNGFRCCTAKAR